MINLMMVIGKYGTSCVPSRSHSQWKAIPHVLSLSTRLIVPYLIDVAGRLVLVLGHGALVGYHVDLACLGMSVVVVVVIVAMDL